MHEFSIACSIVDNVLEFIGRARRSARAGEQVEDNLPDQSMRVLSVRVAIGELACVEPEQLSFCYRSITENTEIANSELEIERVDAEVACSHCGYRGKPKYWDEALSFAAVPTLQCPKCSRQVEAREGEECAIKAIRISK